MKNIKHDYPNGTKFNYLTLICETQKEERTQLRLFYLVKCDCGNEFSTRKEKIVNGIIKSCTKCFRHQRRQKEWGNWKWKGHGELSGDFFGQIKYHANYRNIKFNVTIEELWELFVKQGGKCKITNLPIKFSTRTQQRKRGIEQTASLDRIDSEKGYFIDNLQWVHKDVNLMKNEYSMDKFLTLCELVYKRSIIDNEKTINNSKTTQFYI